MDASNMMTKEERLQVERETIERVDSAVFQFLESEYPLTRRPLQEALQRAIRALVGADKPQGADHDE